MAGSCYFAPMCFVNGALVAGRSHFVSPFPGYHNVCTGYPNVCFKPRPLRRENSKFPCNGAPYSSDVSKDSSLITTNVTACTLAASDFSVESSSLREAIRAIATGKLADKSLTPSLLPAISSELRIAEETDNAPLELLLLRASFLGALFMKRGLTFAEHAVLTSTTVLMRTAAFAAGTSRLPDPATSDDNVYKANTLSRAVPVTAGHIVATVMSGEAIISPLSRFALRLLCGEILTMSEAEKLGLMLYADEPVTPIKALIAHVMRVRHETAEELGGLARAIAITTKKLPEVGTAPYALVSEPFDGAMTWDLITPLVARHLLRFHGLQVVMPAGESSGPKYGPNLLHLSKALRKAGEGDELGIIADQALTNPGAARWVQMRRIIVKRPALATVEKYADACPNGAQLFIASAFHPGYIEKMAVAAEAVGFPAYIIIGKGVDGSIGLGVRSRSAHALVGWKTDLSPGAVYQRQTVTNPSPILPDDGAFEFPKKHDARVDVTVQRILDFIRSGSSGDAVFDARVTATTRLLDDALSLIRTQLPKSFPKLVR